MIDREQCIQWAKDAGIWVDSHGHSIVSTTEALQALITRAQNEAYDAAAKIAETPISGEQDDITMEAKDRAAEEIRALKQEP